MFHYEYEKPRPVSVLSCDSRTTMTTDWSRVWSIAGGNARTNDSCRSAARALPDRPAICGRIHSKPGVPLKVWVVATVSCFTICLILVLATIAITKWGITDTFSSSRYFSESKSKENSYKTEETHTQPTIDKHSIANEKKDLMSKKQYQPEQDLTLKHLERRIEKKNEPKALIEKIKQSVKIPEFKPTLPDIFRNHAFRKYDNYDDYFYNDENLYDDYIQSTSLTSYLLEKLQEIHDWLTKDKDFVETDQKQDGDDFTQVLQALNSSIVEGNVTLIMNKLKNIFYNDNHTVAAEKRIVLTNKTDLLSFGILTLDIMLLHNIQLIAWESQSNLKTKMLKDQDVYAFNALFMDPTKVGKQNEQNDLTSKRQNVRLDQLDNVALGKNVIENIMEFGMNTARAVIHLGKTYKNTKTVLNQLSNKEQLQTNIQTQMGKNILSNTHALKHLQSSYIRNDSSVDVASLNNTFYTELDCVWLLYCRNLVVTAKLSRPYGVMARINGVALRMLSGELTPDKAIDTLIYEAMTGWTDLRCNDMFPRCSKVDASKVILDSITQPTKKNYVA